MSPVRHFIRLAHAHSEKRKATEAEGSGEINQRDDQRLLLQ